LCELALYKIIKTKTEFSKYSVFVIAPYIYKPDGNLGYIFLSKGRLCRTNGGELEDLFVFNKKVLSSIGLEDLDIETAASLILYPYSKIPDEAIKISLTLLKEGTLIKDGKLKL